jgi:hypothetical protein
VKKGIGVAHYIYCVSFIFAICGVWGVVKSLCARIYPLGLAQVVSAGLNGDLSLGL